jgi:CubicO group peptidase (beta-lactamase class C family)
MTINMNLFKEILLSSLFTATITSGYTQESSNAQIDSIFSALYNSGQFSGNVLIAQNGIAIYEKCFGLADIEKQVSNTPDTRFLLASVSKQFTAVGIVLLKEAGKLSYDDEVVKYIPELPYPGITIRQVLDHTSGLPDYDALMQHYWDKTQFATNNDMLNMLIKYHPSPFFPPGQKYLYSNTGYALLAVVIERVSGMSFTDYMEMKVFSPLGMAHTIIFTRRARPKAVKNYATGYVYADSLKAFVIPEEHPIWRQALWEDGIYGEDGVNATIDDMLKWDQTVYQRSFISSDDWQQILTPGKPKDGNSDYGFGWHLINPQEKGRIAFHSGGWPGFMTYNEQGLDQNYSIIILRNKFTPQTKMPIDIIRSIIKDAGIKKNVE